MTKKIPSTEDAWDEGQLGRDEAFTEKYVGPDFEVALNQANDLQPISIRLPKSLIESFKLIAQISGGGMRYQTLMRQALRRFAECEMKRLLADMAVESTEPVPDNADEESNHPAPQRRAA